MAKNFTGNTPLTAKPKDKPYELRDGKTRGLLLRVQPTGKKSWIFEVRSHEGRKRRITLGDASTKTLDWARKQSKKVDADPYKYFHAKGADKQGKSALLGAFLDGPYKDYAETHLASGTNVISRLKRNFGHLSSTRLDRISEMDIERWKQDKGVKYETLVREFSLLKTALNRAVKEFKIISSHQLANYNLKRPRNVIASHTDPRYLSDTEEKRLREALAARDQSMQEARQSANEWRRERGYELKPELSGYADHLTPMVLLALNTGLRRGDLFDLEWQHVNFNLKHIRKVINKISHTKFGETPKTIPLSGEALTVLKKWQKQTKSEGLVFPNPVTGKRLDNINKAWGKLLKDAKIENFRFHDLRHTFASKLVMAGIDLNTVRELMCHSDIKMTLVYAHLSPGHKENAIDRVFNQQN